MPGKIISNFGMQDMLLAEERIKLANDSNMGAYTELNGPYNLHLFLKVHLLPIFKREKGIIFKICNLSFLKYGL